MGNKRNRNKQKPRRSNTPLAGHAQTGRVLQPPMKRIAELKLTSWLRDSFPDWLAACVVLAPDVAVGRRVLISALDLVSQTMDQQHHNGSQDRPPLDGSLSAWDRIPLESRDAVLKALTAHGLYELVIPEELAHLLGMYLDAPGRWIIEPRLRQGVVPDVAVAEATLNATIVESFHGQGPVATAAKALAFRGLLASGKLNFPAGLPTIDLLVRYPNDLNDDQIQEVEAFIRAAFGAGVGIRQELDGPDPWPPSFWRANWTLYRCMVVGDDDQDGTDNVRQARERLLVQLDELWTKFDVAAAESDPDLYTPDRHEVLTGITARSLRLLAAAAHSAAYWTAEHSAPLTRSLVESLITLSWLIHRDEAHLYERFKDFGRGHLKLWKLHLEAYADSLDDIPAEVQDQVDYLDGLVNEELSEEFQDIDIGGSFAGVNMRKMAQEVELQRDYQLVLAPASADFHGEWGNLARYALVTCANPAHRFHRIHRRDALPPFDASAISVALDFATRLVTVYADAVRNPPEPAQP